MDQLNYILVVYSIVLFSAYFVESNVHLASSQWVRTLAVILTAAWKYLVYTQDIKTSTLSMQTTRRYCSSCRTMRPRQETPSTCVSTCPSLLALMEPSLCSAMISFMWPTRDPLVLRTHGMPAKYTHVSYWTCRVELYPIITGWYTDVKCRKSGKQNQIITSNVWFARHELLPDFPLCNKLSNLPVKPVDPSPIFKDFILHLD